MLGGITVVGCEAEGAAAVPQTAGKDEKPVRCLLFDLPFFLLNLAGFLLREPHH